MGKTKLDENQLKKINSEKYADLNQPKNQILLMYLLV